MCMIHWLPCLPPPQVESAALTDHIRVSQFPQRKIREWSRLRRLWGERGAEDVKVKGPGFPTEWETVDMDMLQTSLPNQGGPKRPKIVSQKWKHLTVTDVIQYLNVDKMGYFSAFTSGGQRTINITQRRKTFVNSTSWGIKPKRGLGGKLSLILAHFIYTYMSRAFVSLSVPADYSEPELCWGKVY